MAKCLSCGLVFAVYGGKESACPACKSGNIDTSKESRLRSRSRAFWRHEEIAEASIPPAALWIEERGEQARIWRNSVIRDEGGDLQGVRMRMSGWMVKPRAEETIRAYERYWIEENIAKRSLEFTERLEKEILGGTSKSDGTPIGLFNSQ